MEKFNRSLTRPMLRPVLILLVSAVSLSSFITAPVPEPEITDRAWESLRFITEEPRSFESEQLRRTEKFITEKLQNAGMSADVFEHTVSYAGNPVTIRNIYSEIRGTGSQSVMFLAHYDSAMTSPGAGDNGIAVAVLLEVVTAFYSRVNNPGICVKILFTDGEELGLLGARAFVENYPALLEDIMFVINVEGYGSGPLMLIQGNDLAELYFSTAAKPAGFSIIGALSAGMRFDTQPFLEAGIPSMTIASISGQWNYHSPGDSFEHVSRKSFAQYAGTLSGLLDLITEPEQIQNLKFQKNTYFMLSYGTLISYGRIVRWFIVILTVAMLIVFVIVQRRKNSINIKRVFVSFAGIAAFTALNIIFAWLLYRLVSIATWNSFIQIPVYWSGVIVISACIIAALILPSLLFLKKLLRYTGKDSFNLALAVLLAMSGGYAAFAIPGLEYLLLLCAMLISVRSVLSSSKIAYYLSCFLAGILFLPLLYLAIMSRGAQSLTIALFAVFFLVFYALFKDYPGERTCTTA